VGKYGEWTIRDEYDFSKGERGKFYHADAKLNLPIYLEKEVLTFIEEIARKKDKDLSAVVNQLLHSDMQLADMMKE
jgi:hypothetical protein